MTDTELETAQRNPVALFLSLARTPDALEAGRLHANLANDAYAAKDLALHVVLSIAGISHCLTAAARMPDADASKLKEQAKVIAYNLGANVWPGWEEPGIVPGHSDLAIGIWAAKLSLTLVEDLGLDDNQRGNGEWLVGALQLAIKEFDAARASFENALRHFQRLQDPLSELMAEGYICVAETCSGADGTKDFESVLGRLASLDHQDAGFISSQLKGAHRIFSANRDES